jgi:hypothetical protein
VICNLGQPQRPVMQLFFFLIHVVIGWLQLKLIEKANEGNMAAHPDSVQRGGVGAAIERLEENLSK